MSWDDWAWIIWIAYFLIAEGIALFNSRGNDTLSEHVWIFLGYDERRVRPPTGTQRLRRFATLAFLAWLAVHLLTGGIF